MTMTFKKCIKAVKNKRIYTMTEINGEITACDIFTYDTKKDEIVRSEFSRYFIDGGCLTRIRHKDKSITYEYMPDFEGSGIIELIEKKHANGRRKRKHAGRNDIN